MGQVSASPPADPQAWEGPSGADPGLALLQVKAVLTADKTMRPVTGALTQDGAGDAGAYLHGPSHRAEPRAALLAGWGAGSNGADHDARVDAALDEFAAGLLQARDIPAPRRIASP